MRLQPLSGGDEVNSLGDRCASVAHALEKSGAEKKLGTHLGGGTVLGAKLGEQPFGQNIVQIVDPVVALHDVDRLIGRIGEKTKESLAHHSLNRLRHLD